MDNYVYFKFHANDCFIKRQVSSKVLLRGALGSDGLYKYDNLVKPPTSSSQCLKSSNSMSQVIKLSLVPSLLLVLLSHPSVITILLVFSLFPLANIIYDIVVWLIPNMKHLGMFFTRVMFKFLIKTPLIFVMHVV